MSSTSPTEAPNTSRQPTRKPKGLAKNRLWIAFKSVKTGIFLLCLIALACIYGTVHYAANSSLGDNAIPLAKDRVFYSWWFFLLLGFFFVQFIISTWRVTIMSASIWWKRTFIRSSERLAHESSYRKVALPVSVDQFETNLKKNFTRSHRDGNAFFAQRGLASRLGPTIIHVGIVTILVAGLVRIIMHTQGQIISEGRFVALEGETSNRIFVPKDDNMVINEHNLDTLALRSFVKVHDFDEIKHPNSESPAYFSSLLEIIDPETGNSRVVKVDMNNSVTIDGLEFHQASYTAIPPIQDHRTNYDIRQVSTGKRVAVTDASPDTRVQLEDLPYFFEVDGEAPGDAWRIYAADNPNEPFTSGLLMQSNESISVTLKPIEFYPDFALDTTGATPEPYSRSNELRNAAVHVEILHDGNKMAETMLFLDPAIAKEIDSNNPYFRFELADLQVPGGKVEDVENHDWSNPINSRFVIEVFDKNTHELAGTLTANLHSSTDSIKHEPEADLSELQNSEATFAVYPAGRTIKYATVLSVVREPVVPYYMLGVVFIFIGAMMTFVTRYTAFYGLWNPDSKELELALVPRFGKATPEEMDRLIEKLTQQPNTKEAGNVAATNS